MIAPSRVPRTNSPDAIATPMPRLWPACFSASLGACGRHYRVARVSDAQSALGVRDRCCGPARHGRCRRCDVHCDCRGVSGGGTGAPDRDALVGSSRSEMDAICRSDRGPRPAIPRRLRTVGRGAQPSRRSRHRPARVRRMAGLGHGDTRDCRSPLAYAQYPSGIGVDVLGDTVVVISVSRYST